MCRLEELHRHNNVATVETSGGIYSERRGADWIADDDKHDGAMENINETMFYSHCAKARAAGNFSHMT